jgi:hypothetical protein
MVSVSTPLWRAFEERSGTVFLIAGGSFAVATAINGLDLFTPIATQEGLLLSIEGIAGFGAVVLSFLGLLGLYPRVKTTTPRLGRAGIIFAILPGVFFFGLFAVCSILAPLLGLPSLKTIVPSFDIIMKTMILCFAVALTLFGVGSLRTAVPSRIAGGLLLVLAAAWFAFFGALQVYHYDVPIWVTFVQTTMMAAPLVSLGYHLRTGTEPYDRTRLSPTTGD